MNNLTFFVYSLGCKVNNYEAHAVQQLFLEKGMVYDNNNPDVIVINTCAVTHVSEQKSRQHIRRFKKQFPHAVIVVMGCYSQKESSYCINQLEADIVVGTTNKYLIYDLLIKYLNNHEKICLINKNIKEFKYEEICQTAYIENVRSYLKIQDGCNNFCSYCLIPYLRGKPRSRSLTDIVNEAKHIVSLGIKEIVVSGIHIGSYGYDLENVNFAILIEQLLKIDNLKRLTISSIEASEISDDFINLYLKYPNLAKHIHIPLQSGSEKILKLMNRKYNKKEFLSVIKKLKNIVPDIAITTDVIVGFPGESDENFKETYDFIKEAGFAQLHVFPFSKRENTLAYHLKNQVDEQIKKSRAKSLRDLSSELYEAFKNTQNNKTLNVLIESYNPKTNKYFGHSENYIGVELSSDTNIINTIQTITYINK